MRIALGSDQQTSLTGHIQRYLEGKGHQLALAGALRPDDEKLWPHVGFAVAQLVVSGRCDTGIALCWTGTGVCLAANKAAGARAALCSDAATARGARLWDDANILALSLRATSPAMAEEILEAWLAPLDTSQRDAEDLRGLAMLADLEARFLRERLP